MLRLLGFLLIGLAASPAAAEEYFERYDLTPRAGVVHIGLQPLGYPTGVVGAVMRRDRVLREELAKQGQTLNTFAFRRGPDMVALVGGGRLAGALMGDMPTIATAIREPIWIVGLVKLTFSSVVSREEGVFERLKGKRIGYVEGSSAHHALLQGLASAGLGERDVELIPMGVDEMPEALEQKRIEAFSAWEPAPSVALAKSMSHRVVFRGQSTDFFILSRSFEEQHPEAARQIVAGFVRAVEWLRRSRRNQEQAVRWAMTDGEALSGRPAQVTVPQGVDIVRREILDIPSAPAVPAASGPNPLLASEFRFLQRLGKIAKDSPWERVESAFGYKGLRQVTAEPLRYRLSTFDYDQ